MNIHALWCHPRSVSTAFERIMRAREDVDVLHEPFMYHYYLTQTERLFPDFSPEPDHPTSFDGILAMILKRAERRPVFFKDMAYYVVDDLVADVDFCAAMTHTFLVRDPAEAILSYQKKDPGFTSTELGYEAQFRLYEKLRETGLDPLVLSADQLRQTPQETMRRYWARIGMPFAAHAFSWDDSVPKGWESVVEWHDEVLKSGGIKPAQQRPNIGAELEALGSPYIDYDRHHRPFYDKLMAIADIEAHQK